MIVIAIIGVLAVTLIPQLTKAQAKARDTGRSAHLNSISTVLQTYRSDVWTFPTSNGLNKGCLSDNGGVISSTTYTDAAGAATVVGSTTDIGALSPLFQGGKAPLDPQWQIAWDAASGLCNTAKPYAYQSVKTSAWADGLAALIVTRLEVVWKGNYKLLATTMASDGSEPNPTLLTPSSTNTHFALVLE